MLFYSGKRLFAKRNGLHAILKRREDGEGKSKGSRISGSWYIFAKVWKFGTKNLGTYGSHNFEEIWLYWYFSADSIYHWYLKLNSGFFEANVDLKKCFLIFENFED